jgi:hypothetical protein
LRKRLGPENTNGKRYGQQQESGLENERPDHGSPGASRAPPRERIPS